MVPFEFFGVGRVVFGRGTFGRAGELAAAHGRSALVVYNGPGHAERLTELLRSAGVRSIVRRQKGEPVVADVDAATEAARRAECDLVIGLGGGSAIDAAKAVAGLLANGGSAVDYMEVVGKGQKITRPATPWIAIPTTAGTGAEATRNAVIGLPEKQFKASLRSDLLLSRAVLIDPELGVDVPPEVTARTGMDALCQLIESYTSTGANPMTDALAIEGIRRAARSLERAFEDGKDLDAREDIAMAALLSGITLTSAGLGAVHGFAAPLGANFPVPHGTVCAALLPHVIRANIEALRPDPADLACGRALDRYARVGRLLAGDDRLPHALALDAAVRLTSDLVTALRIPPLSQFGLDETNVCRMVQLARKASSMRFNPVALTDEALANALLNAIRGISS
jgi:alcohol dehydrogenase class IV